VKVLGGSEKAAFLDNPHEGHDAIQIFHIISPMFG
jgi:hypothetical protein